MLTYLRSFIYSNEEKIDLYFILFGFKLSRGSYLLLLLYVRK